jgi:hypothetical protein
MSLVRDRAGLIARIRHLHHVTADMTDMTDMTDTQPPPASAAPAADPRRIHDLETRIEALEGLVQGLQDSVYRESERQSRRIGELEAQIQPAALNVALSRDARERGL